MRLHDSIKYMAFSFEKRPVSQPRYSWLRSSPQEARAMYRKRTNSFLDCRSKPSAILEVTESEARRTWSRKNSRLQSFKVKNSSLFSFLASCQTIRSSNFSIFAITTQLFILSKYTIFFPTSATFVTPATSVNL